MLILMLCVQVFLGFYCLSLSLTRHYTQVFGATRRATPLRVRFYRFSGYSMLLFALFYSVSIWGLALGLVYGLGTATFTATILALLLTYMPRRLTFGQHPD